ncbi:MAG TPA: ABC transporter ATP-binding protein [Syntrophobacteria bacterium]|nr:ABC transporter ATP-binding protein [Syntrophobacteria bacterium]
MSRGATLSVENLRTYFYTKDRQAFVRAVDGVDFKIETGETVGLVGESGSGKTMTALSILGLNAGDPGVISGTILYGNGSFEKNLLQDLGRYVQLRVEDGWVLEVRKDGRGWRRHSERLMRGIRGKEIAMIFQDPRGSLNPFVPVGKQIAEAVRLHAGIKDRREAREKALFWLEQVRIDSPGLRYDNYPYGLSGGMCQRVLIAMALASEPSLLIADEPTTGLDATIQAKVVDLLEELKSTVRVTTLLISHDIQVIRRLADRVAVMYGGGIMEYGAVRDTLAAEAASNHPYTAALLGCIPDRRHIRDKLPLQAIEGDVVDTLTIPEGCRFYPRCNQVHPEIRERCQGHEPELREISPGHWLRCWLFGD